MAWAYPDTERVIEGLQDYRRDQFILTDKRLPIREYLVDVRKTYEPNSFLANKLKRKAKAIIPRSAKQKHRITLCSSDRPRNKILKI